MKQPNKLELYHHGILGQKWGVRRTEAQLGRKNKRIDDKQKKKYTDNKSEEQNSKFRLSDSQKRAIKIGAAVAATTLVAYGGYKLAKSGKLDAAIAVGKNKIDDLLNNGKAGNVDFSNQKISSFSKTEQTSKVVRGIKMMAKQESLSDTIKNVNPLRNTPEGKNNCTLCSMTSFLRQHGYNVTAGSTNGKMQNLGGLIEECFKGAKVFDGSAVKFGKSKQDAAEMLVKRFGQEAEGVCAVQFKNGGGHAFNWSIKKGVTKFFDGQTGLDDAGVEKYWKIINPNDSLILARLDNAEINLDTIQKYVNIVK